MNIHFFVVYTFLISASFCIPPIEEPLPRIPNTNFCNEKICPSDKGICTLDNLCFCDEGYLTIFVENETTFCNYKQKDQMVFLLLEFLVSFGIGHFYAGRYIFGAVKCAYDLIIMSIFCCCKALKKTERAYTKEGILKVILMLLFLIWQVIDAVYIGTNKYLDGKGFSLGRSSSFFS